MEVECVPTIEISKKDLESLVGKNPDFILLKHDHIKILSTFAFPLLCKTPELKEKYMARFSAAGIEIRPMIAGNIEKQPFYSKYIQERYSLAGADLIHNNGFYCGNYPELTEADIETICSCLRPL